MLTRRKLFGLIPIPFLATLPMAEAEEKPWEGHGYVGNFMTIVGGLADEIVHRKMSIVSMDCAGLSDDELKYAIDVGRSCDFAIRIDKETIPYAWVDDRGDRPTVSYLFWGREGAPSWTWVIYYDDDPEVDDWTFIRTEYSKSSNDWTKTDG